MHGVGLGLAQVAVRQRFAAAPPPAGPSARVDRTTTTVDATVRSVDRG